ncbi:LysM peptidoglycan-binding domain-containing protein [Enterococcus sp. LJL99]
MKRMKVKMVLFFSFSIALGAIAGFVHSASSLIEASAPSNPGTTVAPATGPESEKKKEQATTVSTSKENDNQVSQTKEAPKKTNNVESDQTLWEIAHNNGLTLQELMNRNQLTSTVIVEGQELIIEK